MRKFFIVILFLLVWFIFDSKADFQFPDRSVSAQNNQGSSDFKSSLDMGDFTERALVCWEPAGVGVMAPSWAEEYECGDYFASAFQDSAISSNRVTAKGFTEEWNPFLHPADIGYYWQSASTVLNVNLVVETSCWIVLNGTLNAWGDYGGSVSGHYYTEIILESPSEVIYSAGMDSYDNYDGWWESNKMQINESIALNPGTYSFHAEAGSFGIGGPNEVGGGGYAYFNIEIIPEPCTWLVISLGSLVVRLKNKGVRSRF